MKQSHRKISIFHVALILLCAVIILTCILSGIFARYVRINEIRPSARVIQFEELTVTDLGKFSDESNHTIAILPGANLPRDVSIKFGGSESATFVFLQVNASGFSKNGNYNFELLSETTPIITFSIKDDPWIYLKEDNGTSIYYTALEPNESLSETAIEDGQIAVSNDLTRSDLANLPELSLQFDAWACQSNGFNTFSTEIANAEAAWDSVKKH